MLVAGRRTTIGYDLECDVVIRHPSLHGMRASLSIDGEEVRLHTLASLPVEEVDMLTVVLVGNSSTYVQDGRMVTPRGYPGAPLA